MPGVDVVVGSDGVQGLAAARQARQIVAVEHAVAVVSGAHKAAGALGALRGGFLNVLIADEATAREILRLNGEGVSHHD